MMRSLHKRSSSSHDSLSLDETHCFLSAIIGCQSTELSSPFSFRRESLLQVHKLLALLHFGKKVCKEEESGNLPVLYAFIQLCLVFFLCKKYIDAGDVVAVE